MRVSCVACILGVFCDISGRMPWYYSRAAMLSMVSNKSWQYLAISSYCTIAIKVMTANLFLEDTDRPYNIRTSRFSTMNSVCCRKSPNWALCKAQSSELLSVQRRSRWKIATTKLYSAMHHHFDLSEQQLVVSRRSIRRGQMSDHVETLRVWWKRWTVPRNRSVAEKKRAGLAASEKIYFYLKQSVS